MDASPAAAVLSNDAAASAIEDASAAAMHVDDAGAVASEEERKNGVGAEVAFESRYVWRGIAFSQGPVIQPSASASLYGFTFEMWSNVILNDEEGRDRVSALEPSLTFALTWDRLKLEPGVVLFRTPSEPGPEMTSEATLEASYRMGAFHLVSGTYVDIETHVGAYFGTLGGDYERSLDDWTIKALVDVGWATPGFNDAYFGVDVAALNLVHASLSARYDLTDLLYFSLSAEASTLLNPSLRRSVEEPTLGSGGAAIGLEY